MATYQILSWHGIPIRVKASDEDGQVRENLPERYQVAIDAVAMATELTDSKSYMDGFQWADPADRSGNAQEVARAVVAELVADFPPRRMKEMRHELEGDLKSAAS